MDGGVGEAEDGHAVGGLELDFAVGEGGFVGLLDLHFIEVQRVGRSVAEGGIGGPREC